MPATKLLIEFDVDRDTALGIWQSNLIPDQFDLEERLTRSFSVGEAVNICLVLKAGFDVVAAAGGAANALRLLFESGHIKRKMALKVRLGQKESVTEIGSQLRHLEKSCMFSLDFHIEATPDFETDTTNTLKLLRDAKTRAMQKK